MLVFLLVTLWMLLICNCCMVSFFMFAVDVSFWVGFDQEWGGGESDLLLMCE